MKNKVLQSIEIIGLVVTVYIFILVPMLAKYTLLGWVTFLAVIKLINLWGK
jgi:hypothetical protein